MIQSDSLQKQSYYIGQRGQAMVEYAILLILLVMIVVGGAEIGISAFHASKTGDGAKAAANEWAEAVGYSYAKLNQIKPTGDETLAELNARVIGNQEAIFNAYQFDDVNIADITDCALAYVPGSFDISNANLPIKINACDLNIAANRLNVQAAIDDIYPDTDFRDLGIFNDFYQVCTDSSITKIEDCQISGVTKWLVPKTLAITASEPRILINKGGVIERKNLGDHSIPSNFTHPNCDGTSYDNGLPDDTNIYLFNPLPIDITNCDGSAGKKVGELVGGTADYEGLPKLNQAIYSQYTKVCVDYSGGAISIQPLDRCVENGFRLWLKPPGKMCGAGAAGTEYCPGQGDLKGATGYYFFGDSNVSGEKLKYLPGSAASPEFRPTFQLVCEGADFRDENMDALDTLGNPACSTFGSGSFSLQVHTRYRAIFESFLTFGIQELVDTGLLDYFYNPNKVGVAGSNQLVGTAGSEIGPLGGDNLNPTVKYFRDFRGCYRVDITPPDKIGEQVKTAVSSCN